MTVHQQMSQLGIIHNVRFGVYTKSRLFESVSKASRPLDPILPICDRSKWSHAPSLRRSC